VAARVPPAGATYLRVPVQRDEESLPGRQRLPGRGADNAGGPPTGGPPAWYQDVCTPDADGLFVEVIVTGTHPPLTAVQTFRRLKLLGSDLARWTTQPLR
jgi:hypothetical protein